MLSILSKTQDLEIAKDCCQQALLIALTKLRAGEVAKPASLPSFLRNTAINVVKVYFRKERRYTRLNGELSAISIGISNEAEQEMDGETIRQMLNDFLDLLTVDRDKEILRRLYLRGEEKDIIRRDMDLSAAHFDRVIYRARIRLRHLLQNYEGVNTLLHHCLNDRTLLGQRRIRSSRRRKVKRLFVR